MVWFGFRSLGIRITINRELYGYDIPIPEGHRIDPVRTQIVVCFRRHMPSDSVFKYENQMKIWVRLVPRLSWIKTCLLSPWVSSISLVLNSPPPIVTGLHILVQNFCRAFFSTFGSGQVFISMDVKKFSVPLGQNSSSVPLLKSGPQ